VANNWCIGSGKTVDDSLPDDLPALVLPHTSIAGKSVRVCAVGDIVFSVGVRASGERIGYRGLFDDVARFLKSAPVCFGNLECALTTVPERTGFLVGPPEAAAALCSSGFTIVNLANNHVYDAGPEGLASTLQVTRAAGLVSLGAGDDLDASRRLIIVESQSLKLGWLGCGRTLLRQAQSGPRFWEFKAAELLEAIRIARERVDVLFTSIHIGYEYVEVPSPEHRQLAHDCVAAGANVVLMHHAHVLQGLERVGDRGVVCYNLGNFLMDPACGYVQFPTVMEQRRTGAVFVFDLDAQGHSQVSVVPTYLGNDFCVRWAVGDRGRDVLSRLAKMSAFLESRQALAKEFARQRAERNLGSPFTIIGYHLRRANWRVLLGFLAGIRPRHFRTMLGMLQVRFFKRNES
jgi:hypothetical protein